MLLLQLIHPAPPQPGVGRAQGSPPLLARRWRSQSPASPMLAWWGQPSPRASSQSTSRFTNASVLTRQSILKSQAARPRKSNYSSQPCAPADANRAASPGDLATSPMMPGLFLPPGRIFALQSRASTQWSPSAARHPPAAPPAFSPAWSQVGHSSQMSGGKRRELP